MKYLLNYALGGAFCLAICAIIVWQLRLGLTKGYMHRQFGRVVERAKNPISFWMAFVFHVISLLVIGALLVTIIFFAITQPG